MHSDNNKLTVLNRKLKRDSKKHDKYIKRLIEKNKGKIKLPDSDSDSEDSVYQS